MNVPSVLAVLAAWFAVAFLFGPLVGRRLGTVFRSAHVLCDLCNCPHDPANPCPGGAR